MSSLPQALNSEPGDIVVGRSENISGFTMSARCTEETLVLHRTVILQFLTRFLIFLSQTWPEEPCGHGGLYVHDQ